MSTATQTREQWLAERQNGVGGSDAPAACGLSKWKTPYELWLEKTQPVRADDPTEAQLWGLIHEAAIIQRYADLTGYEVVRPSEPTLHPVHDFARCNLDGLVIGDRIVQAKTSRFGDGFGDPGTDEIPEEYNIQVQHEMGCAGLFLADVPTLIGGNEFAIYTVEADPELQEAIFEAEAEFWQCVLAGTPPDPTTPEDVKQFYSRCKRGDYVEADENLLEAHHELGWVRDQIKTLESRKDELEDVLKLAIKDHEGIAMDGKPLATWKNTRRQKFDKKSLAADYPDLVKQYTTEQQTRTFLYKKAKS